MTLRLAEFRIEGLFGLYTHRITLNSHEHITIIIGPNGRGKTVCLKFIEALFCKKFSYFKDIPFRVAEFRFVDGKKIRIEKAEDSSENQSEADKEGGSNVKLIYSAPGKQDVVWSPGGIDPSLRRGCTQICAWAMGARQR